MHPLLEILPGEVHLWLSFTREIADPHLLASYLEFLTDQEAAREQRFYFARDRHRYRVTRAMVRTVLSRYARIAPADWAFSVGPYGRPAIANADRPDDRLSFNISHTDGLVALGVARRVVGVDVENVMAREVSIDIADRFFAPAEVAALALVPPHRQQDRFFEYWTLKEAYIKARGMGLSLPLDRFGFIYPRRDAVDIVIDPELRDAASRWQFWQFRPAPQYLIALCAERGGGARRVVVRSIVPGVHEHMLDLTPTRHSSQVAVGTSVNAEDSPG